MKVVKRTADYTVYQKRSERYAVQGPDKAWINGDDKAKILLEEGLIKVVLAKPVPAEEPEAEPETEPETEEGTEASAEEASDSDSDSESESDKEAAPEGE